LLGDRLQAIVFNNGKFFLESAGTFTDSADFWPEPSYESSADIFDPLQSPAARRSVARTPKHSSAPGFRHGDVLVTIGLDWEYPGLHDEIRALAKAYGLTVIACCYDLIPVLFPQYCVGDVASWFKNYVIDMTWSADGVLCISENTRRDYLQLARSIGLPPRHTQVIKLGSSLPPQSDGAPVSPEVKKLLDDRFFLFVSTIERRKNHEVLYRAYHLIRRENPEIALPKLVFVGMEGWGIGELMSDIRLDPLTKDDIIILPHVSDSDLSRLYAQCEAFLYPSHYEGWGLPVAEALELGRPVLASSAGSIPEVGGDLVRYLDPWSPREWADELSRIISGEVNLDAWSAKIAKDFIPYEWASAAQTVISMALDLRRTKPDVVVLEPGFELSTFNGIHYADKIIYNGGEGIICHGPYMIVPAGSYISTVHVNWVSGSRGRLGIFVRADEGRSRIAEHEVDARSLTPGEHRIRLPFELVEDARDLEFYCQVERSAKVKLSIDRIVIERVKTGSRASRPSSVERSRVQAA
jgi:glycosyltransferase involved in cell wall biosynthesis